MQGFARIPSEVLHDKKLTLADRLVYAVMAEPLKRCGVNIVTVSYGEIADAIGISKRQAIRSIRALGHRGYISTASKRMKRRNTYELRSQVFSEEWIVRERTA